MFSVAKTFEPLLTPFTLHLQPISKSSDSTSSIYPVSSPPLLSPRTGHVSHPGYHINLLTALSAFTLFLFSIGSQRDLVKMQVKSGHSWAQTL